MRFDDPLLSRQSRLIDGWWWLSVPYVIVEVLTKRIFGLSAVSSWELQHRLVSLLITTTALVASLSSFVWFIAAMYKTYNGTIAFNARRVVMLVLSAIAALPSIFFVVMVGTAFAR